MMTGSGHFHGDREVREFACTGADGSERGVPFNANAPPVSPAEVRNRAANLARDGDRYRREIKSAKRRLAEVREELAIAPSVEEALEQLSGKLLDEVVLVLEEKLTIALREVLDQPISLRADSSFKRGGTNIEFYIEREGRHEDIMKGQGGSVANILSVGLRLFALTALDPGRHRRFLVLDEQDCWLHPDLVPKLVRIIHDAGRALGFQILLISHHDVSMFENYADRIYRFEPGPHFVEVIEQPG